MNREGKKCVLYPRVSTEMQVDGYSLEGQKNSLKRFADREEMEIVGVYEDAGKSGKSIEGRPAFKKMLSDIKNGLEIDYILVYKLSRFGRNAADILNSLEFVQSYGINLICIEEGIDSSQTSGKLLISVLSAVAEIERENIIEQTMNGRREKARQGGWNGGFAPYGYYLENNQLLIEETEAKAIRIIFEKFGNSDIGLGGVAKYLNLQGIKKIPRQNGKLETWSSHLIRQILDNPVYCGKIAYGRRTREKVKGTKNEYKQVHTDDYILEEGQHEGIVSEELWEKVRAKRIATGIKQPSKVGKDRSHLLTGVLKCPMCGSSMYTNKHAWTNKDGTYKEVYYYICGRNKQERGHHCDYKASLRKTDIEPLVIEAVKELVSDKYFAREIKSRIGIQTDTSNVDKEIANYESKLKEVDLNKARLEREIDNLPADARYRERKIHDMTLRLDGLYDTIVELEERIEDAKLRRSSIEMEAITLENVYKIMKNFGKLYAIMSDEEKKSVISYLIKEIQIYPNGESEMPLKSIEFNFPIYRDGKEVRKVLWERGNTVETFSAPEDRNLLSRVMDDHQKCRTGNEKLLRYLADYYLYPSRFEDLVYASQLMQAEAIESAVEHFRRQRGYCMGSTYWQFNDCWPVASWASIDYFGRWKALHYAAKRFYAPVAMGLFLENGTLTVNIANETRQAFRGAVRLYLCRGDRTVLDEQRCEVTVEALSSLDVLCRKVDAADVYDTYLYADLYDASGSFLTRRTQLLVPPEHFSWRKPRLTVTAEDIPGGVAFRVSADVFAKNVYLDFRDRDLVLSDNYFDLTAPKAYTVTAQTQASAAELLPQLTVKTVYDIR